METSEVIYSCGLSVFSIILMFLIAYLQIRVNKSQLRQWCMMILTCSIITNISMMFQIININQNLEIWYEAFSIIGIAFMPICCFLAVTYFFKKDFSSLNANKNILLFLIPIISVFFTFTNNIHHLIFEKYSDNLQERQNGIFFYVMLANIYFTYLLTIISALKYLLKDFKKYRKQIIFSFLFIIFPIIFLFLANLQLFNIKSYSIGIIQSLISIIIIEILLKYQILTEATSSILNVLNNITDGFIVINKKGNIIAYNDIFVKMFDLDEINIKKINIQDLLEFKEFDTLNSDDIKNIISITDYNKNITFERTSSYLKLSLKYIGTPLLEDKNNDLYLISIIDITGYAENIKNIKLNKDALLGHERLASLGQMIGGIAHNLKTPIFSIAGAIEGIGDLVKEYKDSIEDSTVTIIDHKEIAKDMYSWTEKISGYLSYMTDIITAIQMQTSSGDSDIDDSFTIKELIKYINILMKYELSQNLVNLQTNIEISEDTKINGNINNLIQVLNNLISNAIQAYEKSDSEKIIKLNISENKNDILIEIQDYAGGISEEVKNKLFKEMVTTKGKNGTGLGLFISYTSIKTSFGGNLCFTTKEGDGTIFKVIIPKERKI